MENKEIWLDELNDALWHGCYEIGEPIIQVSSDDIEAAQYYLRGYTPAEYAQFIVQRAYLS